MKTRYLLLLFVLSACSSATTESGVEQDQKTTETTSSSPLVANYTDPLVMEGAGILALMQDLSAKKEFERMADYTSGTIVARYGREKVIAFYSSLDLSFKAEYTASTDDGDVRVLTYKCTNPSAIRKLRVVEEGDTVRVWPHDFEKGMLLSEE